MIDQDYENTIARLDDQIIAELEATIAELDAQLKFIRIGYEVLVQTGERHALDAVLGKNDGH